MTDEQNDATTFKPGDRVRRVSNPRKGFPLGYETTVLAIDESLIRVADADGATWRCASHLWQKVEAAPSAAIVDELKAGGIQAVMDAVDADRYGTVRSLVEWGERMERERDALKALATRTAEVVDIATHYEKRAEAAEAKAAELEAENARLREALGDLLSWFPSEPMPAQWNLKAGPNGADDAIMFARAALAASDKGGE